MIFNTSIVQLPISHINLKENCFQITTNSDISNLVQSIKKIGLISPPLIYSEINSDKKPGFTIVSGFRRIKACCKLGLKTIDVRIADKTADNNVEQIDLVRFAIAENAFQRSLNLIEKSRAYTMLSRFFPDKKILEKESSALGLSDSFQMIKKIQCISQMPKSVQKCILEEIISLAVALELSSFETKETEMLVNLFTDIKLSISKQREVLNLLKDISLCHEISIIEILNEKGLCEILQDQDIDKNLKASKLRKILKQRRYPAIVEAEKTYEKYVKELKLGQSAKLVPPKNFEGTIYSLILNFSNIMELKKQNEIIKRIIQEPALEKILE